MSEMTQILSAGGRGDQGNGKQLLPLVYDELRRLAASRMHGQRAGHSLQPTLLVHEAWLRLAKNGERTWESRTHFFHAAAEAIRHVLIEHARRKASKKHGGGQQRVDIAELDCAAPSPDDKILLIDEALELLSKGYPEHAKVVVMKYYAGMTDQEVAVALQIGERTVRRHWVFAKLWLFNQLNGKIE
ncbi:MAG TPA: sigma-70 family RNA polymerase sigma factor [Verrucomicrobiae bacterium]